MAVSGDQEGGSGAGLGGLGSAGSDCPAVSFTLPPSPPPVPACFLLVSPPSMSELLSCRATIADEERGPWLASSSSEAHREADISCEHGAHTVISVPQASGKSVNGMLAALAWRPPELPVSELFPELFTQSAASALMQCKSGFSDAASKAVLRSDASRDDRKFFSCALVATSGCTVAIASGLLQRVTTPPIPFLVGCFPSWTRCVSHFLRNKLVYQVCCFQDQRKP
mmetsp:Transcript_6753/g.14921  ORF Transcript_6753/g.14921 Transcript_6753/m.14921 type:complete len:226 (-) Transcript_6753:34-711(-)